MATPNPHRNGATTARWSGLDALCLTVLAFYAGFVALLVGVCLWRLNLDSFAAVFRSADIRFAARLSVATATFSAVLSLAVAIPAGYALSRRRFPGRLLADTLVDIPIVLPPLVVGVALLVFFRTPLGLAIEAVGPRFVYAWPGIVLSQFLVVSPYAIRIVKSAFDGTDRRVEEVSRTLGWSAMHVFFRVSLPLARNAIVAAGVVAWALAMGLFGPMMVFAGTTRRKTEVLATSIYLEMSIGNIDTALAISIVMIALAATVLIGLKRLAGRRGLRW